MNHDPNVAASLLREKNLLSESRTIPACADLTAMLTERVTKLEQLCKQEAEAARDLEKAELDLAQARSAFNVCERVMLAGTLDDEQAIRNHEAHVVTLARVRALAPAAEAAKSRLATLRGQITKPDRARDDAQNSTERIAGAVLRGNARHLDFGVTATASAEIQLWWPYWESKALSSYDSEARNPEYRDAQPNGRPEAAYGPPDRSVLEAAYRARRQAVQAHAQRLRAELQKLGGEKLVASL